MRFSFFQKSIIFFFLLFLLGAIALPAAPSFAQDFTNPLGISVNPIDMNNPNAATELAKQQTALPARIVNVLFGFLGIVTLLIFIWGGFQWMTAQGNAEKVDAGKSTIVWGVLGLAVIALSYPVVFFLLDSLVRPFTAKERATPPPPVVEESQGNPDTNQPTTEHSHATPEAAPGCCRLFLRELQGDPRRVWECEDVRSALVCNTFTSSGWNGIDVNIVNFHENTTCASVSQCPQYSAPPPDKEEAQGCCRMNRSPFLTAPPEYTCLDMTYQRIKGNTGDRGDLDTKCQQEANRLGYYQPQASTNNTCATRYADTPNNCPNIFGGGTTPSVTPPPPDPSGCCVTYTMNPERLGWLPPTTNPPSCRDVTRSQCGEGSIFIESPLGCQSEQLRPSSLSSINDICNPSPYKLPPPPGCCYWYPNFPQKTAKECREMLDQEHCEQWGGKEFLKGETCPRERTGPNGCKPHDL